VFLRIFGKYEFSNVSFKRRWLRFTLKGQITFCFCTRTQDPSQRKDNVIKNRICAHPACEYSTHICATHRKMTINLVLEEFHLLGYNVM
jgi:hypothetical protein